MKLLDQFADINQANKLYVRLKGSGILTYVSSSGSYMLSKTNTGALRIGLWVVLDDQYNDAKSPIRNFNHKVKCKLTEREMAELEQEANQAYLASNKVMFEKAAAWLLSAALLVFAGYIIYSVINEA